MIEIEGHLFDWDKDKNISNIRKHGISFKIAATSFFDPDSITVRDWKHSNEEDRFVHIGFSKNYKLLTVSHYYRDEGNVIRIISARKATATEQHQYKEARNES